MLTELDAANALRTLSDLQAPELPRRQCRPSLRRIALAAAHAALLFAAELGIVLQPQIV